MPLIALVMGLALAALWTLPRLGRAVRFRNRRPGSAAVSARRSDIEDALLHYLMGCDDLARIRGLAGANPEQVQKSILDFVSRIRGEGRDRLCDLLIRLSFIGRWCSETDAEDPNRRREAYARLAAAAHYEPVRRTSGVILAGSLTDADEEVRFQAARALARSDDMEQIARVFRYAIQADPHARLMLARDLRPHAAALCRSAVPEAAAACSAGELPAMLRMLESWECVLPIDDLTEPGSHPDPAIRLLTMRVLRMAPATPANLAAIRRAMEDADADVRAAALAASQPGAAGPAYLARHLIREAPGESYPAGSLCTSGGY